MNILNPYLAGLTAIAFSISAAAACPTFEQYPVKEVFKGPYKPANIHQSARVNRIGGHLYTGDKIPPNFAGHMRIFMWACGTECAQYYALDQKTGHVYLDIAQPIFGADTRVDSRLLIIDGPSTLSHTFQDQAIPKEGSAEGFGYKTTYFVWDDVKHVFTKLPACAEMKETAHK